MYIRRAEKITHHEANGFPLEAYMKNAEAFFQNYKKLNPNYELKEKTIYLVTDDITAIEEEIKKYFACFSKLTFFKLKS